MNIDILIQTLEYASLAEQIHTFRSSKEIRPFFNNPLRWNLSEDFFLDAIDQENIRDISFIIHKIPITGSAYIRRDEGDSLLSFVVKRGSLDDITILLRYTGRIHTEDALQHAIERGNSQIISLVVRNTSPQSSYNKDIVAYAASIDSSNKVITLLVQTGYSMYIPDESTGNTAMDYAILKNDISLAETLVILGFNVNEKDATNYSYLEEAIKIGNIDMIQLLLKAGAMITIYELYSVLNNDRSDIVAVVLDSMNYDLVDLEELHSLLDDKGYDQSVEIVYDSISHI